MWYATPPCLRKQVYAQDLDGSSFMGSRLRIEHARDSRDSRRDGGRWSPPRGRFSWVTYRILDSRLFKIFNFSCCWSTWWHVLLWWFIHLSLIELFFSRGNPPGRRTGYRTIVENLSSRTSWQDLKDFMRKVTNTNLCLNSFLNVMNLTLRDSHDPLCVIILNIIIPNLYFPLECGNENCDLSLTVVLQAGEITYTNTNQPRVGEGIVEFGSRLARKVPKSENWYRTSRRDMEYALDKLDGEELDGRRIRLVEEGGGRRSRSRSRSRSRTRSRSRSR